jgi:hypothetical protein
VNPWWQLRRERNQESPFGGRTSKGAAPQAIGRSCVRFKRLGDVDPEAQERLLRAAVEAGFPGA